MYKNILVVSSLVIIVSFAFLLFSGKIQFLSPQQQIVTSELTGSLESKANQAIFNNRFIKVSSLVTDEPQTRLSVLGSNSDKKLIEVDLTNQKLYAYEGDQKVFDFPISSGLWGRTPTGKFKIWIKLRYTRMQGGSQALGTYYNLPNVPFTMFFYNDEIPQWRGFGIHGAYWHNNFGHPMSHGCINMKIDDAGKLYYWAMPNLQGKTSIRATDDNPGTEILIYGTAPLQ